MSKKTVRDIDLKGKKVFQWTKIKILQITEE